MAIKVYSPTDFEDTSSGVSIDGNLVVDTSVLYVDTANDRVGIGTTSPSYKLDVAGAVRAGTSSYRTSINGDSSGANISFGSTSDVDSLGIIGAYGSKFNISSGNGDISFQFNNTERMRITSGGNVGIGTTGPSQKLTVEGNIELGTGGYIYGDTTNPALLLNNSSGSFLQYTTSHRVGVGAGVISFTTSGSERMRVTSSGNVGIGTSSPGSPLDVQSSENVLITATSTDAGAKIKLSDPDNNVFIQNQSNTLSLGFSATQSGQILHVSSSGNVGIGTTTPSEKLEVNGNLIVSNLRSEEETSGSITNDNWYRVLELNGGSGRGKCEFVLESNGGSGTPFSLRGAISTTWSAGDQTLTIHHNSLGSIKEMRVVRNSAGNKNYLDIKSGTEDLVTFTILPHRKISAAAIDFTNVTTLPSGDTVQDTVTITNKTIISQAGNYSAFTVDKDSSVTVKNITASGDTTITGFAKANSYRLGSSGNIAISESSGFLYIDASSSFASGIYINNAVKIDGGLLGSYNEDLQLRTGGTTRMTLSNSSGNVGIGTTSPAYKLDVAGEVGIDSYIRHNGDSDTFFGFNNVDSYKIRVGGADRMTMSLSSTIFSNDVSSTGYLQTYGRFYHREHIVVLNKAQNGWVTWATRDDSGTDSVIDLSNIGTLHAAGNVGIGTTSPDRQLQVHASDSGTSTAKFTNSTTGEDGDTGFFVGINTSEEPILYGYNATNMRFGTNGADRMRITSGGNVLIGTTTDGGDKLQVVGNVKIGNSGNAQETGAYTTFDRLILENSYSDVARGPNKVQMHNSGSDWLGGFGVHSSTVAYYSGQFHTFYHSNSQTSFTEVFKINGHNSTVTIGGGSNTITNTKVGQWDTAYSWGDHSTQSYATQSYVNTQVSNLVDSAPSTLDTLNELAAALGDDPNFATTVTNNIAAKLPLAGGTLTGDLIIDKDNPRLAFSDQGLIMNMRYDGGIFYIDPASGSDRYVRITNSGAGSIDLSVDGNVGIGTTSPSEKLDIAGNIKLSGIQYVQISNNASITPSAGDWIDIAELSYGEHHGRIALEWNSLYAPSSSHHGWAEFEVGTYYSSSYNYGQDTYLELVKAIAHNNFWLDAVRAVDYGSTVRIQVKAGAAVSQGTFKSYVLNKKQGTVNALTPAINANSYTVLALANIGTVDGEEVQKAIGNHTRFSSDVAFDEKVGIGTTSPVSYAKLSVNGNVKIGNGASANILYGGFEGAILNQTAYQGYNIVYSGGDFQSVKLGGTNDPTNYYYNTTHVFGNRSNVEHVRITSGGNVGIGTTSPAAKLSVNGAILAGGKYSYRKAYASLDTTGAAVAGLNTSSNGASAMFKFEMHGGIGHYQKVVYSCHNSGGNWFATKVIDEGTNELDVEASANNNTTITFTFKARNSTQYYSPAVTIEASGGVINTTYL